ncbi:MAG: polysaccharide deacetylase family protein [Bacteroidetes bacterium]|nr:polysaccharide deacetylase family protein [Bacteroidota bacterium]
MSKLLHHLLPRVIGIPVLMYHHVLPGSNHKLSISPEKVREQWQYLRDEGYKCLPLNEFLDIASGKVKNYPKKSFLLTFDDGYTDNLSHACTLLKEFGWTATFFIVAGTLDGSVPTEGDPLGDKMTLKDLRSLDPSVASLAIHGYLHEHFDTLNAEELKQTLEKSIKAFETAGLPFHKVLAYPYGERPSGIDKETLLQIVQTTGIKAAFRIGNRINKIPVQDIYGINRIDIWGTHSIEDFKIKLKKGKLKPF